MPPAGEDAWAAGDYTRVARLVSPVAEAVVSTGERMAGSIRGRRVLDVGCGTGTVARAAVDRGARVTAVDASPAMLGLAAAETHDPTRSITWKAADMHALPDEDGSFDVVLSSLGVIFARDPAAVLAEIIRVLRPGGVLALSTWAAMPEDPLSAPLAGLVAAQERGRDPWGSAEALRCTLSQVVEGLSVTAHSLRVWFADLDEAMGFVFRDSPAHLAVLATVPTEDYLRLRRRFEDVLLAHRQDDGSVAYDRPFLVAAGRRL